MSETLHIGVKAIARRLGVSKDAVRNWIRRHGLPVFRTRENENSPWLCLESSLSAWLVEFERRCRAENPVKLESRVKALESRPFALESEKRPKTGCTIPGGGNDHAPT